jgi:hypothetical protein
MKGQCDTIQDVFSECSAKNMNLMRWLQSFNVEIDHRMDGDKPFLTACLNGNLNIARWLWNLDPTNRPNHRMNNDIIFCRVCENGHLVLAKWLWSLTPSDRIDHRAHYDYAFYTACKNGHFALVKWLWDLVPNNRYSIMGNYDAPLYFYDKNLPLCLNPFDLACCYGHLDVAKWIWKLFLPVLRDHYLIRQRHHDYPLTILAEHFNIQFSFTVACYWGHFDVALWLWNLDSQRRPDIMNTIDVMFLNEGKSASALYRNIPRSDNIAIKRWLLSLIQDYNSECDSSSGCVSNCNSSS